MIRFASFAGLTWIIPTDLAYSKTDDSLFRRMFAAAGVSAFPSISTFTCFVWIPATIWLFYTGTPGRGVFMGLWGLLVVSSVDNIIKPWLISRESRLPILLVFLGVLGGVIAFGFIGLFLSPTLLAVGYTLLHQWIGPRRARQGEQGPAGGA